MTPADPTQRQEVAEFFEQDQAGSKYRDLKAMTRLQDLAAARRLNAEVRGELLCVGGLWEGFERGPQLSSVAALDLSPKMLEDYGQGQVTPIVGDLFTHVFPAQRFDTVVFSLVLHHVAQGSWRECEGRIREALGRAATWLRPGGKVYVLEYCPHPLWMPLQRAGLPATSRFLKAVGQPLVVMHDRAFYERQLKEAGFSGVRAEKIQPPGFDEWAWFPVFMATPWLRMPVKLYPKLHLLEATR